MTREQALAVAARIWCDQDKKDQTLEAEAASKIADILMEYVSRKVPFAKNDSILVLWADGQIANAPWIGIKSDFDFLSQGNIAPDTTEGRKQLELEARRRAFRAKPRKEGERAWVNFRDNVRGKGDLYQSAFRLADILGLTWATREEAESNQPEAMELFWDGM